MKSSGTRLVRLLLPLPHSSKRRCNCHLTRIMYAGVYLAFAFEKF